MKLKESKKGTKNIEIVINVEGITEQKMEDCIIFDYVNTESCYVKLIEETEKDLMNALKEIGTMNAFIGQGKT